MKWKFFPYLQFLADSTTPRQTLSTLDDDDDEENIPPPPTAKRGRKVRQDSSSAGDALVQQATSTLQNISNVITERRNAPQPQHLPYLQQADDDSLFGETIARIMRDIPNGGCKDNLKLEIQRIALSVKYSTTWTNVPDISSGDNFHKRSPLENTSQITPNRNMSGYAPRDYRQ